MPCLVRCVLTRAVLTQQTVAQVCAIPFDTGRFSIVVVLTLEQCARLLVGVTERLFCTRMQKCKEGEWCPLKRKCTAKESGIDCF